MTGYEVVWNRNRFSNAYFGFKFKLKFSSSWELVIRYFSPFIKKPIYEIDLTDKEIMINRLQVEIRGPWTGVRLDPFTHHYAMESMRKYKPKVIYIAYGETDDWTHDNEYDQYLRSAGQTGAYIREIWDFIQSEPEYRDKTTLIITTDHGRGTNKSSWKSHGLTYLSQGRFG